MIQRFSGVKQYDLSMVCPHFASISPKFLNKNNLVVIDWSLAHAGVKVAINNKSLIGGQVVDVGLHVELS